MRLRIARALRVLLCGLMIFNLFPGSEVLVETVAHLVHDGHLPHSDQHDQVAGSEDCDDSDEHGCTPLSHHCGCCASLAAIPPSGPARVPWGAVTVDQKHRSRPDRGPPNDGVKPFLPPPIA
jgi:hypothetical protein